MTYLTIAVLAIVVLNTYPVAIARDLVFVSKENTLLPHTQQMAAAVESLERITPETVNGGEPELIHNADRKPVKIKISAPKKRGKRDTA